DKERWVRELDAALLAGEIDCAVHSAKDVPAHVPEGVVIAAVPERADPRDALCGAPSLDALPEGARVGTSSLRRAAQLRALREDLDVLDLRGNVDTRQRGSGSRRARAGRGPGLPRSDDPGGRGVVGRADRPRCVAPRAARRARGG